MILYIRVSRQTDADLFELYKYIPHGLGRLFKSVLLDYFKYYTVDKGEYKFEIPKLNKTDKELEGSYSLVTIKLNKQEERALEGLFSLPEGGKSTFVKNLTRMYMGTSLAEISRPLCGEEVGHLNKPKPEYKPEVKPEIRHEVKPESKTKKIFTPQEF